MDVGVAMLGARMQYAVPVILHQAGLLGRLYTDSYRGTSLEREVLKRMSWFEHTPKLLRMYAQRYAPQLDGADITRFEWFGIRNALDRRGVQSREEKERLLIETSKRFGQLSLENGIGDHKAVYAFKGAALEIFQGTRADTVRILEQSILPHECMQEWLAKENLRPHVVARVSSFTDVTRAVQAGHVAAVLPDLAAVDFDPKKFKWEEIAAFEPRTLVLIANTRSLERSGIIEGVAEKLAALLKLG
jgi:hypothetical protein